MKKFNEFNKINESNGTGFETVGQLIEFLSQFDKNTKVAINVAEEPSEILEIFETTVGECTGRGASLNDLTGWDPDEPIIMLNGEQY
jgi:hypothetical protein